MMRSGLWWLLQNLHLCHWRPDCSFLGRESLIFFSNMFMTTCCIHLQFWLKFHVVCHCRRVSHNKSLLIYLLLGISIFESEHYTHAASRCIFLHFWFIKFSYLLSRPSALCPEDECSSEMCRAAFRTKNTQTLMTIFQVTGWTLAPNGQLNLCDYCQAKQGV